MYIKEGFKMSRNAHPEETGNLILDVSQMLFIQKGYDNTTIQDIVDNLGGMTKGAVYHHFSSKAEILTAVTQRLFSKNTLSRKWEEIKNDTVLNGAQKLKKMLIAAIYDEQEQTFRNMGIHLQNMPQMLSDLLIRSVNDIAPSAFQGVIEEGIADGSIDITYAPEFAQLISIVANIWINPIVFPVSDDELKRKFMLVCELMKMCKIDISDIYPALESINER